MGSRASGLLCLLAVCVSGPSAAQPSSWPQFRGNPRLTGIASADVPATLSLKWTYQAGETIESSASIVDGAVYVGAGNGDLLSIEGADPTLFPFEGRWWLFLYVAPDLLRLERQVQLRFVGGRCLGGRHVTLPSASRDSGSGRTPSRWSAASCSTRPTGRSSSARSSSG